MPSVIQTGPPGIDILAACEEFQDEYGRMRARRLTEPHFAVKAETGLQPLLMGFTVSKVPISWINRTEDMGLSSSRLAKVGGGYWQVLVGLAIKTWFGLRRLEPGLVR